MSPDGTQAERHQGGCRARGAPEVGAGGEGVAVCWFRFLWVAGRGAEAASSGAALSCHPSPACLLPPLLPGSCSTIKVSIAHLKCEMRAQWEEVACSFVPWRMKRPNKMQMDWRRPCGLVATTGSEECELNSWQYQCCGFAVGLEPARWWGEELFFTALPSDQLPVHPSLFEGAAGQACCKRWAEVCISGELEKSWGLVSPFCLITANPLSAAAAVLRQDRPLRMDCHGFKRSAVLPWLGRASSMPLGSPNYKWSQC